MFHIMMAKKYLKRCSTISSIREKHSKMAKSKKVTIPSFEDLEPLGCSYVAGGNAKL